MKDWADDMAIKLTDRWTLSHSPESYNIAAALRAEREKAAAEVAQLRAEKARLVEALTAIIKEVERK
jgi:histidinol-phosphate/aromatic aminotransferase/cobyric acid decarboxylase-like protein